MLEIFSCLLLAHVLSDFVLQTNYIYKLKTKSGLGIFMHVLIFFFLSVLLCFPFTLNIGFLFWLIAVSVSHYFIDKIKLFFQRNIIQKELSHFFLDQSLHVFVLATSLFFFKEMASSTILFSLIGSFLGISGINVLFFVLQACFSVYVAYGISVILYYYDRTVDLEVNYLKHNYFSMLVRIIIFLLLIGKYFYVGIIGLLIIRQVLRIRLVYEARRFFIENFSLVLFVLIYLSFKLILLGV